MLTMVVMCVYIEITRHLILLKWTQVNSILMAANGANIYSITIFTYKTSPASILKATSYELRTHDPN